MKNKGEKCNFNSAAAMASYIQKQNVRLVDACFCDPLGTWHHCTFAPGAVQEDDIKKGFGFDGSSIRLFSTIDKSDMAMIPDVSTCWIDPFSEHKIMHVTCNVAMPDGSAFDRCPRTMAARALKYVKERNIADDVFFGPEAEFFIFDNVGFNVSTNECGFKVDCEEGVWNSSANGSSRPTVVPHGNLGHRNLKKGAYFPVPPADSMASIRSDMLLTMEAIGIPIEKHHHEVAGCQHELGYACRPLMECADLMMSYKYVVKNVAAAHNKTATFMPKPLHGDCGSGFHCHQSLWKAGVNLFFQGDGKYQKLSTIAMHYIGGILEHAPALLALTNPTTNSYKRLVPGFEAPTRLAYSKGNRSAAVRIPMIDADIPKCKRIEFRCPDAACCPYIAFSAMLLAGVHGVENKTEPGDPMDCDIYDLDGKSKIQSTPISLDQALDHLEKDHSFLTKTGVFTEDFIAAYIKLKRDECRLNSMLPTPLEFEMYYSC